MDAIEALRTRRSVRRFKPDPISSQQIETIVDTARLAATARNEQPWEFIVVTDERTRQNLAALSDYGKFIAQSPVCVVVFCKDTKYYLEDGSAATENLLVAAHALGIGSCWVAGDKKPYAEDIRKILGVPEGHRLVSMIALGYPDSPATLPAKRKLSEVLHWEQFSRRET